MTIADATRTDPPIIEKSFGHGAFGQRDTAPLTPSLLAGPLRAAIGAVTRAPEPELMPALLDQARLAPSDANVAHELALRLARSLRERSRDSGRAGLVQGLLQEFALSSQEGVALLCLAEALLRIPDRATRDALIRDKIGGGDWRAHVGGSESLFVNAAAWGLLVTGKLVSTHSEAGLGSALARIVGRGGEPLIRKGVDMAMRLMGEQFVTGETIENALSNAPRREAEGFRYSYDMLGEAALTMKDADRYFASYQGAIDAIGRAAKGRGFQDGPGISVKLSALHPRYVRAQALRVQSELFPRLLQLAEQARRHDIGLNIDAEECDRLELSLDLLERLCFEPALKGWNGVGFVIQAYQKRCPALVDWIVDLARRSSRRLMLRLVKGAYWDSEIKRAQLDGQSGYPVYTRKAHTDVAYLVCAKKLLAAPDAVYPQFATHNAQTLAAIHTMAGPDAERDRYEFQCLHGMGEPLYEQVVRPVAKGGLGRPCRIYAPVGTHETLLAYLVRRLLENGANTSFVNRIADEDLPIEALIEDPVQTVERSANTEGAIGLPHPAIPLPRAIYGDVRPNSLGLDLNDERQLAVLASAFAKDETRQWRALPLLGGESAAGLSSPAQPLLNPAEHRDVVGQVQDATVEDVEVALACAQGASRAWADTAPKKRAAMLERAADALEAATESLIPLLAREAGKSCANAVAEVREAVDFLRYYAALIRRDFDNATHRPLGLVVCISPWNLPLAIFCGQVAAALAAGNCVLAKPAEQTPLVAAEMVRLLHSAGVPRGALQLLPGRGETVGAALVSDARVQGVLFTGSTEVARILQRTLSQRLGAHGQPVPLIGETGGQNAMIVDSSALAEQAVADAVASAFDSAGQRCSALRVLCVQSDAAPRLIPMLEGAVRELKIGDPRALSVDVGPVIDAEAKCNIDKHIEAMRARGRRVTQPVPAGDAVLAKGSFAVPTLIEIGALSELEREVFGPVLHVLRYERAQLPALLAQINATGYGLTFGVHTRIDETVAQIALAAQAGNLYVNRNIVGAVVGVQPFGGEGLSGTGPKAGGPLYLLRLLSARPQDAARRAVEGSGVDAKPPVRGIDNATAAPDAALQALRDWAQAQGMASLARQCDRFAAVAPPTARWRALPGPTGEANLYTLLPREVVLCLIDRDGTDDTPEQDRLTQLAAVLAVGARALWPAEAKALRDRLPALLRERIALVQDWTSATVHFDALLHHGSANALLALCQSAAARAGPIVGVTAMKPGDADIPLERLVTERSLSINTAAAGGNASLMTIG